MWTRTMISCLAVGGLLGLTGYAQAETSSSGSLVTTDGRGISGDRLRELLDEYIPTDNAQSALVVLTQCYGGDMVDELGGRDGTAVVSATSEGETASYGGYDDDAAKGLKPEQGRTSDDLHTEASAEGAKAASETPSKDGKPVPLDPVDPEKGPIKSRHILVYAGSPDGGNGTSDEAQLQTIKDNFAGEPNTTVTAVGGDGTGAWDHPGTEEGLKEGLEEISELMNPDEQFILFVTDHGDQDAADLNCKEVVPGVYESLPLRLDDSVYPRMAQVPDNVPALTIFVPVAFPLPPAMVIVNGLPIGLADFSIRVDLNNNGVQDPGDGWEAWLPINEETLDPTGTQVQVQNVQPFLNVSVRLSSGAIGKDVPASACEGDANGDGVVDPLDAGFAQARFGCTVGTGDASCDAADQNGDSMVDPLDVGFILARLGQVCEAAGATSCSQSCGDGSSCSVTCSAGEEAWCYCANFGQGPATCSCLPD